ncbi:MAG: hypothetical protein GY788_26090 [bacterium]|nr:hypothetical protein [bacterium]
MKRYRPQMLLLLGAAITMASIAWEIARMNPQTSYLVEPWSTRGFESIHGSIAFTIGALIFGAGLLTMLEKSLKPLYSVLIALLMALGAIGVAAIYGTDDRTMGGGATGWVLAFAVGWIVKGLVVPRLPEMTAAVKTLSSLAIVVATASVMNLLVFGSESEAQPVVWVGIAALVLFGLASAGSPVELAANRMLIISTVGGGIAIALGAAAIRANLITAQLDLDGVASQYKDTQVTSGYFLSLFGMLLAFVGAVSLWAKRRDIIINQQRAEKQRLAAEASAAEIQAALEVAQQHQREARAAQ